MSDAVPLGDGEASEVLIDAMDGVLEDAPEIEETEGGDGIAKVEVVIFEVWCACVSETMVEVNVSSYSEGVFSGTSWVE